MSCSYFLEFQSQNLSESITLKPRLKISKFTGAHYSPTVGHPALTIRQDSTPLQSQTRRHYKTGIHRDIVITKLSHRADQQRSPQTLDQLDSQNPCHQHPRRLPTAHQHQQLG